MEWTNDEVIRLVKSYKQKGVLWDPSHDLYRVQTAKYEAWCELAELFGCEISDLRKKFNSIFASHRREKAKIRLGAKPAWFLYKHLSFLPTHMSVDDSATTQKSNTEDSEEQSDDQSDDQSADQNSPEEDEDNVSNSPVHVAVKEESQISTPNFLLKRPYTTVQKRKLDSDCEMFNQNTSLENKVLKRTKFYKKKDECDSFGEYIAISLRKHDERTRSMIKQAINNILFEQEMKKYNSGQYTTEFYEGNENPLIVPDECNKEHQV